MSSAVFLPVMSFKCIALLLTNIVTCLELPGFVTTLVNCLTSGWVKKVSMSEVVYKRKVTSRLIMVINSELEVTAAVEDRR